MIVHTPWPPLPHTPTVRDQVRWWWQRNGYKTQRRRFIRFVQRGLRGYSTIDVWGLDSYLCDVISGAVAELRRDNHGHPGELTPEQWEDVLDRIAAGMNAGRQLIDLEFVSDNGTVDKDFEHALKIEFDEAMDLLKAWFFGLWD